jgi:hypothetical protein
MSTCRTLAKEYGHGRFSALMFIYYIFTNMLMTLANNASCCCWPR